MAAKSSGIILKALLTVVMVVSLYSLLPSTQASAATWYVDLTGTDNPTHGTGPGTNAFKTITYAVGRAGEGDIIQIGTGAFVEQVEITKALTLIGVSNDGSTGTRIVSPTTHAVYTTHSSAITDYVVVAHDCQDVRLYNLALLVYNPKDGGASWFANAVFDNVTGTNSGIDTCLVSAAYSIPQADFGVSVYGASTVTVNDSGLFWFTYSGVISSDSRNTVSITRCLINGNNVSGVCGVTDFVGTTGTISGCEIYNCLAGVNLSTATSNWSIINNAIYSCTRGIYAECPLTNVTGNFIYNNVHGIRFSSNANALTAHCNAIMGNTAAGLVLSHDGTFDVTNNYWGDNSGPNVDGGGPGTGDNITTGGHTVLTYNPWAAMHLTATPTSIPATGLSTTTLNLDCTRNSAGNPMACTIPNGLQITFASTSGTVSPATVNTAGGHAITTLRSSTTPGTATVTSFFARMPLLTISTVQVPFTPFFTITATAGENGAISPSGAIMVNPGASQTFTITPNSGYSVASVLVDGVPVGAVSSYTFTNVTANHTISASLINTYNAINTGPTSHGGSLPGVPTTQGPVQLPSVNVSAARLSSSSVEAGSPVTVTADITNKSTANGSKKVTLYVNGQVESTQVVTVNSGGSTQLTFNVSRSEPGDYTVYVDGVPAGSYKVELFNESDSILIFSAILVALAFLIGIVMLWRRQQRPV